MYILGVVFPVWLPVLQIVPPKVIGTLIDLMAARKLKASVLMYGLGSCHILIFTISLSLWDLADSYLRWRSQVRTDIAESFVLAFYEDGHNFLQKHRTGDLMAHATNDLTAILKWAPVFNVCSSIITGGTTIVAMIIFLSIGGSH